jgi:hypothetical protein
MLRQKHMERERMYVRKEGNTLMLPSGKGTHGNGEDWEIQ